MNEWEEDLACARRKALPAALMLFSISGDGGEQRFGSGEYLEEGEAARSLLTGHGGDKRALLPL